MHHAFALTALLCGVGMAALFGTWLVHRCGFGRMSVPARAVLGLATVAVALFAVQVVLPWLSLRLVACVVWGLALALGMWHWNKMGRPFQVPSRSTLGLYGLGIVLLVPVWNMVGFGDELDTWMVLVKETLLYDAVPRHGDASFSPWRDFFGLSSMMQVAILAPLGSFHGGVGRILTLLITWAALGEVGRRLQRRHGESWGAVGNCALALGVVAPFCEIHASWYVDAPLGATLLLATLALHDMLGDDGHDEELPGAWARLTVWFAMAVLFKPHGGLIAVYLGLMALSAWLGPRRPAVREMAGHGAAFLPGLVLWSLWRIWGHQLDDTGVGTWGLERLLSGEGTGLGLGEIVSTLVSGAVSPLPNPPLLAHYLAAVVVVVAFTRSGRSPWRRWMWVVLAHYLVFLALFRWVLRPDQVNYWARYSLHAHYVLVAVAVDGLLHSLRAWGGFSEPRLWVQRAVPVAVTLCISGCAWFLHNLPREEMRVLRAVTDEVRHVTGPEDHVGIWAPQQAMLRLGFELAGERKASLLYALPYRTVTFAPHLKPEEKHRQLSTLGVSHLLYCPRFDGPTLLGVPAGEEACVLYKNLSPGLEELVRAPVDGIQLDGKGRLRRGMRRALRWFLGPAT